MNSNFLFEILKLLVAGIGVVYVAFYLLKPYLDKSESLQLIELKKSISSQTLPLRFQAYERLVLFIERVNPANMLLRLNGTAYSADQFQDWAQSVVDFNGLSGDPSTISATISVAARRRAVSSGVAVSISRNPACAISRRTRPRTTARHARAALTWWHPGRRRC